MASVETRLPGRASIDTAQEILSTALSVEPDSTLEFDASEVEAIDGPTVLVLANVARTFTSRGATVAVIKPTPAFVDAFADLGLFEDLMKMEFRK